LGDRVASTRTPEFRALNPNGLVPVIESDDGILWESNTICRYLASRHGRDDLLPATPWRRALVERWMDWQATELNSAWRGAFQGLVRKDAAYADPSVIAASARDWNDKMEILAPPLDGRIFHSRRSIHAGRYFDWPVDQSLVSHTDRTTRAVGGHSLL
jgi:glutathione S-transferase